MQIAFVITGKIQYVLLLNLNVIVTNLKIVLLFSRS